MSSEPSDSASGTRGNLVVISGPSGAGKTSICAALRDRMDNTEWSVSVTTRPPRAGEQAAAKPATRGPGLAGPPQPDGKVAAPGLKPNVFPA